MKYCTTHVEKLDENLGTSHFLLQEKNNHLFKQKQAPDVFYRWTCRVARLRSGVFSAAVATGTPGVLMKVFF